MTIRYTAELKKKALELYDEISGAEVVARLQKLKAFKDEAKTLHPNTIYWFKKQDGNGKNGKNNGNGHKTGAPARCVQEYMTTFHDNGTVALTLYIPEGRLERVLRQLHLVR